MLNDVISMGAYEYIEKTLRDQYKQRDEAYKEKIMKWRKSPVIEKVDRPANLPRARRLGYKAKQGYIVVRVRIGKGRRRRRSPMGGRKPKHNYVFVQPGQSHQLIAEQRVNRIYRNMEVLNSYWVGEDGNYKFFEVILADPTKASVNISSVIRQGKAFRGLTSAGKKGRPTKKPGMNKKSRRKDRKGRVPEAEYVFKQPKQEKAEECVFRKKGATARKMAKRLDDGKEKKD